MQWIGITGPMGSGKSTVGNLLRQMGYAVLDADQVVHKILAPGSPGEKEVLKTFGENLRSPDGTLDRRALGRVVFADPSKLETLEKILHPRVRAHVSGEKANLANLGHGAAFYDVPLLFEKNMEKDFNHVIVVSAPEDVRRQRVLARTGWTEAEFKERQSRQLPPDVKEKKASIVLKNAGDLEKLRVEIEAALKFLNIPLPAPANP